MENIINPGWLSIDIEWNKWKARCLLGWLAGQDGAHAEENV